MRHAGKAQKAGMKMILSSLVIVVSIIAVWSFLAGRLITGLGLVVAGIWTVFLVFTVSFFRDPEPVVPDEEGVFVSPAHGTVDVIDEAVEKTFMGGKCRRVSVFLSIFDVHVQNSPVSGRVAYLKHCPGKFVNAMRSDCGDYNENVLIGIESSAAAGERVAVRLIAGLLARRIVPWTVIGESVVAGERISLIQFGSRVDLYLPMSAKIRVQLGQKVQGGQSVLATRA